MQGHDEKEQDQAKFSRRKFLTKTGAGLLIATLPAKSVWGACSVSGALSGNLSQNTNRQTCDMPYVVGGRSPGGWRNFEKGNQEAKVKAFFSNASKRTASMYAREVARVKASILPLPADLVFGGATVQQGLESNGTGNNNIFFHLSAVYLNAYFGFYGSMSAEQAAEYVKEIYTRWHVRNVIMNLGDRVDSYFNYVDESSSSFIIKIY